MKTQTKARSHFLPRSRNSIRPCHCEMRCNWMATRIAPCRTTVRSMRAVRTWTICRTQIQRVLLHRTRLWPATAVRSVRTETPRTTGLAATISAITSACSVRRNGSRTHIDANVSCPVRSAVNFPRFTRPSAWRTRRWKTTTVKVPRYTHRPIHKSHHRSRSAPSRRPPVRRRATSTISRRSSACRRTWARTASSTTIDRPINRWTSIHPTTHRSRRPVRRRIRWTTTRFHSTHRPTWRHRSTQPNRPRRMDQAIISAVHLRSSIHNHSLGSKN